MKFYSILIFLFYLVVCTFPSHVSAEESVVCLVSSDVVDIITLLDASERDLERLRSCEGLVNELKAELDLSNERVIKLTQQLIDAKTDTIKYKASSDRWRSIAIYGGGGVIVAIVIVSLAAV